jgi:hypothetical protein
LSIEIAQLRSEITTLRGRVREPQEAVRTRNWPRFTGTKIVPLRTATSYGLAKRKEAGPKANSSLNTDLHKRRLREQSGSDVGRPLPISLRQLQATLKGGKESTVREGARPCSGCRRHENVLLALHRL